METAILLLVLLAVLLLLLNLAAVVGVGMYLVRTRERQSAMFADLVEALGGEPEPPPPVVPPAEAARPRTWDEKYEADLEAVARRRRSTAGLDDLPLPGE